MHWVRLVLGYILAIAGGATIGTVCYGGSSAVWITGSLAVLLGALATVSAVHRRRPIGPELAESPHWNPAAAPPLGQMLVNYGLLSDTDLARALKQQKKTGKRLGQTLVEMELVSYAQVAEVLEEQLSRREARLLWGGGERLMTQEAAAADS